jgi:hypothetical protein
MYHFLRQIVPMLPRHLALNKGIDKNNEISSLGSDKIAYFMFIHYRLAPDFQTILKKNHRTVRLSL